ncbi:uncharacterized protein [Pyrus communis]|uniref:uncharacterized protein n=1 Tax=Pyrus communis TaxID=23211 RepID=UPI0035C01796
MKSTFVIAPDEHFQGFYTNVPPSSHASSSPCLFSGLYSAKKTVNLAKLDYAALDITWKNYLTWVLDTKIHLEAGNLGDTIREENNSSSQDWVKAMIFIRRHLDEALKSKYVTVEDPFVGIPLLRKICWKKLSAYFIPLMCSSSNKVNAASLEVNATSSGCDNHKLGRGYKRGQWNRKGKNHGVQFHNQVPRHNSGLIFKNVNRHKGKAHINNTPRNSNKACHRCGGNGHWACTCRTPKHLVDLYQASFKEKGVETNFLDQARPMDIPDPVCDLSGQLNTTHLDVSDFTMEKGNEVYRSD